jgi:hypothetical protein
MRFALGKDRIDERAIQNVRIANEETIALVYFSLFPPPANRENYLLTSG